MIRKEFRTEEDEQCPRCGQWLMLTENTVVKPVWVTNYEGVIAKCRLEVVEKEDAICLVCDFVEVIEIQRYMQAGGFRFLVFLN